MTPVLVVIMLIISSRSTLSHPKGSELQTNKLFSDHELTKNSQNKIEKGTRCNTCDKILIRKKRYWWRNSKEETSTADYNPIVISLETSTEPPKSWGSWFRNIGSSIKRGFKKAGKKLKSGVNKIRKSFSRTEDNFKVFINKLNERVSRGDNKAVQLLRKLGIFVKYDDNGELTGSEVDSEASNIEETLNDENMLAPESNQDYEAVLTTSDSVYAGSDSTLDRELIATDETTSNIFSKTLTGIPTTVPSISNLTSNPSIDFSYYATLNKTPIPPTSVSYSDITLLKSTSNIPSTVNSISNLILSSTKDIYSEPTLNLSTVSSSTLRNTTAAPLQTVSSSPPGPIVLTSALYYSPVSMLGTTKHNLGEHESTTQSSYSRPLSSITKIFISTPIIGETVSESNTTNVIRETPTTSASAYEMTIPTQNMSVSPYSVSTSDYSPENQSSPLTLIPLSIASTSMTFTSVSSNIPTNDTSRLGSLDITSTTPSTQTATSSTIYFIAETSVLPTGPTTPQPFPDIFKNSDVRNRLHEIFLNADFDHNDLNNIFDFDPNDYEYEYDY